MKPLDRHSSSRRRFLRLAGITGAYGALYGLTTASRSSKQSAKNPGSIHEASYYESLPDSLVRCKLCPRHCVVPDGARGHCGVRENRNGRYFTLVYGSPVAINNDPIEKKPLFHVHPGEKAFSIATVGCNLNCKFCQNWDISQATPDDVTTKYISPQSIAEGAAKAESKVVAYTYNEPTIFYEYMFDCAKAAQERGIGNIVISNGFIESEPQTKLLPLLTAYKIDLKAFTQEFYGKVCNGQLASVKSSLQRLKDNGIWFEIVVLLIPTLNDGMDEIKRMTNWIATKLGHSVPVHFSRFHPMYKLRNLPPTPSATLMKARSTAMQEGCKFVYVGNLPGNEGSHTYCPDCKKILIRRYGHMVMENHLKDGKCPDCSNSIPGVWI